MGNFKFFDTEEKSSLTYQQGTKADKVATSAIADHTKKYRYRIEQVVVTKFNGEIINHGTTKQEYIFQKNFYKNELNSIDIQLLENVIHFEPPQLETAIQLLCDFDLIKSDVTLSFDQETGKVKEVINKDRVLERWDAFKKETSNTFNFVKSQESKDNINTFLVAGDQQINNNELLIGDYQSKLFFDIVFDKYLIADVLDEAYDKSVLSNLFDMQYAQLNVGQFITSESPEVTLVRRVGKLDENSLDKDFMIKQYDEKFKPYIGFKFSEYNYNYRQSYSINTRENVINKAEVVITEEIKNNVQIVINYELKLIDL